VGDADDVVDVAQGDLFVHITYQGRRGGEEGGK
jgi:hypothetical protein